MELPQSRMDETVDLPVSEIFTASEKALSYFVQAIKADAMKNWDEKLKYLELALEEDPEFASAYFVASLAYFDNNDIVGARNALQQVMDHYLHKLPEKTQFSAKYMYYIMTQQPEKAFTVVKMWVELFPDDLVGHEMLAILYFMRNMRTEAIAEFKEIIRLDPERHDVLNKLGNIYMEDGNHDSALIYYQKYAAMLPQEANSYTTLGNYYANVGEFELAQESFENALAVADANEKEGIMISLGNVQRISGKFDEAHRQYMGVLRNAKNATDSATAYGALEKYYLLKGQLKRSLEAFEMRAEKSRALLAPMDFAVFCAFNMEPYIHVGELNRAVEILEGLAPMLEPPMDKLLSFGYMSIYTETGDTARAMEAIARAEELVQEFGEANLMFKMYEARAKVDERQENFQEAIENYNKILEISATSYDVYADISRCYRHLKEFGKAEEAIQTALRYRPFDPLNNYEAGCLYLDMGDEAEAQSFLTRAVEIWEDADPDYDMANAARELHASL
jgi:tetratricopeptide (TPR) repeat protein